MSTGRKDLPPPNSPQFLDRAREALSTYLGYRGDKLDRGVTLRDLIDGGFAQLSAQFASSGAGNPILPAPGLGGAAAPYVPDLTKPPTPTGLLVTAAISHVVIETSAPVFPAGHGYARTKVYGVKYTTGNPLPVFTSASLLTEFTGPVGSYPTDPATTWRLWVTWESVDAVESDPAGGVNGIEAVTGQDVSTLLTALTGKITQGQLNADLATPIAQIPGIRSDLNAEVLNRGTAITNEATTRANADTNLAQSITTLMASSQGAATNLFPDPAYTAALGIWPAANIVAATALPAALQPAPAANVIMNSGRDLPPNIPYIPVSPGDIIDVEGWIGIATAWSTAQELGFWVYEQGPSGSTSPIASTVGNFTGWQKVSGTYTVGAGVTAFKPFQQIEQDEPGEPTNLTAYFCGVRYVKRSAALAGAYSGIQTEATARASADSSLASEISTVQASVVSRPNLCPDVDQWTLFAGMTVTDNGVWGKIASASALANGTYAAASPSMPCAGGATYVVTGDSVLFATTADAYFDLQFFDSTGTLVLDGPENGLVATHDFATDNSNRNANAVQVTAPSNAVTMQARFVVDATNAVAAAGFRQVKVERGTLPATPYTADAQLASVTQTATASANAITGLSAQWTVKTDVNGYVAGFGLATTAQNAAPSSEFAVRADRFYIANPSGPGIAPAMPFIVVAAPTTINGVDVPVGVYMNDAFIQNGTITNAKIATAAIDNAKIANVSAAKITAGSIDVGAYIQSVNYAAGSSGWRIGGNGYAEFGAASIRGQLNAGQIDTRGLSIKDTSGNVILAAGVPLTSQYINTVELWKVTGAGSFAGLSQINASNISTYIANAAIGQAQIQNAAIGTAQIQNAAIQDAQIRNLNGGKITANTITADQIVSASATQFSSVSYAIPNGTWVSVTFTMAHSGVASVVGNFGLTLGANYSNWDVRVGIDQQPSTSNSTGGSQGPPPTIGASVASLQLGAGSHTVWLYVYASNATGNHSYNGALLLSYR